MSLPDYRSQATVFPTWAHWPVVMRIPSQLLVRDCLTLALGVIEHSPFSLSSKVFILVGSQK